MKLYAYVKSGLKRLPEIFLDDSGKVSMAKILIAVIVLNSTFLVLVFTVLAAIEFYFTHKLPQWPAALAGTITALVAGISALYASNKFSPTIPFIKSGGQEE